MNLNSNVMSPQVIKKIKTKRQNRRLWRIYRVFEGLTLRAFNKLDGHTTDRNSKWRLRTLVLGAIITASVDIWQLHYKSHHGYLTAKLESVAPDALQSINDYLLYLIDLYHIHKYDKKTCEGYYRQYKIIDKFLDRRPNAVIDAVLNRTIWLLTFIWFTNATYTSICNIYKGIGEILIFVAYHLFLLSKTLTVLSLISHALRIEYRLKMIGDVVEDCCSMTEGWCRVNVLNKYRKLSARIYSSIHSVFQVQHLTISAKRRRIHSSQRFSHKFYREIKGLSKCYFILTEQCEFVNNMFAVRILMLSLNLTVDMIRFVNSTVRYAQGTQYRGVPGPVYSSVVWSALRTFVPAAVFFSLVHYCERAYQQNHRIVRLCDHVVVGKNCESKVSSAISELRAQAHSRPISFTAANFFRFEFPIITTIVATVANYSIILFQSKSQ